MKVEKYIKNEPKESFIQKLPSLSIISIIVVLIIWIVVQFFGLIEIIPRKVLPYGMATFMIVEVILFVILITSLLYNLYLVKKNKL